MNLVIGLTGGIGSGKSTVTRLFEQRGAGVVDTDAIAHALTAPGGKAIAQLREVFGDAYITADDRLDRAAMRQRVFTDDDAKRQLEAILHPMIRQEVMAALARQTAPYTLLVVPLLIETGAYADAICRTLVVDCAEATQISRTAQRSALQPDEVKAIMAKQATRSERLARADDTVENDGEPGALEPQIAKLHDQYMQIVRQIKA
ncbi:dephospho-CoA kinase [Chitinivorax sp. PXF-14]|uniref:dephospho-CoA kinase n=1 Tax=Chitinivorax sp. PXF-14 TaxID=3230488 RepID=UPI0034671BF8